MVNVAKFYRAGVNCKPDQPDIVLCEETKLDCHISSSELSPVDFTIFHKDRNNSGGGVCIAANKNLQVAHCPDLEVDCGDGCVLEPRLLQDHSPRDLDSGLLVGFY